MTARRGAVFARDKRLGTKPDTTKGEFKFARRAAVFGHSANSAPGSLPPFRCPRLLEFHPALMKDTLPTFRRLSERAGKPKTPEFPGWLALGLPPLAFKAGDATFNRADSVMALLKPAKKPNGKET